MKKWLFIIGTAATTVWLTGCSSSYFAAAGYGNDDLYAIHDKAEIARRQQAEAEKKKAEAEARRAEWEARLAEAEANAVQRRYYETTSNPYEDVLADTYESAYARRLRGFESPTYRMPSSYYDFRYGSSFHYVSAYDPAFYNVMVMGDQVWVEPKYITAMFGTWGRPSVYVDPWYYGWNWRPHFSWGFSFGSWGWGFGPWYDPWYYPGWGHGWGWGHPHWGPPHWGGHPHRPYASNIVHRANPNTPPSSGSRYYNRDQRFGTYGTSGTPNRGSSNGHFGVRNPSSGNQNAGRAPRRTAATTVAATRIRRTATTRAATPTTAAARRTTIRGARTTAAATTRARRTTRAATTGAAARAAHTTAAAGAEARATQADAKQTKHQKQ